MSYLNDHCYYKCDICYEQEYLMCKNCISDLKKKNQKFSKRLKACRDSIEDNIEKILEMNKENGEKLNQIIKSKDKNNKIISEKDIQKKKINELDNQISKLKKIIEAKQNCKKFQRNNIKEILEKIIEKNNKNEQILISPLNITKEQLMNVINNENEFQIFEDLSKNIHNDKIKFLKEMFDLLIIKTKSLIKISEFFQKEDLKLSLINIVNINEEGSFKVEQETNLNVPFILKTNLLENNKLNCFKLNSFFSNFQKFILLSSIRLGIKLPNEMSENFVISKKKKQYCCLIKPHKTWISNYININNYIYALYFLNKNYEEILKNIFGNDAHSDWFNLKFLIDDEKIIEKFSIKNERISIPCEEIIEFEGYEILDYE